MSEQRSQIRLIIGLGNPGSRYANTRHNLGFLIVRAFAEKNRLTWKKESRFNSEIASTMWSQGEEEHKLIALLPMTYMNLSGQAVRKVVDYYKISFRDADRSLVVVDDVYLKIGDLRLREKGSSGGHNGLKNIESLMHTQQYARLRAGVGSKTEDESLQQSSMNLESYVLGRFSSTEQEELPQILSRGVDLIECWLNQGMESAVKLAGDFKSNP